MFQRIIDILKNKGYKELSQTKGDTHNSRWFSNNKFLIKLDNQQGKVSAALL